MCYQTAGRLASKRVQQIVINLLNNSAKFTPAGGTVKFQIKNVSFGELENGLNDYLTKPIMPNELYSTLEKYWTTKK